MPRIERWSQRPRRRIHLDRCVEHIAGNSSRAQRVRTIGENRDGKVPAANRDWLSARAGGLCARHGRGLEQDKSQSQREDRQFAFHRALLVHSDKSFDF
jgi:hypothetical protein